MIRLERREYKKVDRSMAQLKETVAGVNENLRLWFNLTRQKLM